MTASSMNLDLFSFGAGFLIALVFATIIIVIAFEIRKKRALAFTRRFAVISEGLSSLKALAFRLSGQLRRLRHHHQGEEMSKKDIHRLNYCIDGVISILDTISTGMMPPTEEIAMEALEGRANSAEQRAYADSIKFRDDVRQLRQMLETQGLDGIGRQLSKRGTQVLSQEKKIDIREEGQR